MTPRSILAYLCIIGAVVAIVVAGLVLVGSGVTPTPSASPTSSSTAVAATPIPTEFDKDAFDEGGVSSVCERDRDLLRSRSKKIATRWVTLLPNDTTIERQTRLKLYVVDGFFNTNEDKLEVYTESEADKARIRNKVSQALLPFPTREVEVVCATNVPDEAATAVNVSVQSTNPAGTQLSPPTAMSMSINWKFQDSKWLATSVSTT